MTISDKQVEELKARHGDNLVGLTASDGTTLVFKRPSRSDFDRWVDGQGRGTEAARELAQSCLVYPDRDGMISLLDRLPGVLMCHNGILDTITKSAGYESGTTSVKKL